MTQSIYILKSDKQIETNESKTECEIENRSNKFESNKKQSEKAKEKDEQKQTEQ